MSSYSGPEGIPLHVCCEKEIDITTDNTINIDKNREDAKMSLWLDHITRATKVYNPYNDQNICYEYFIYIDLLSLNVMSILIIL